ncbi:hypothetical protein, partial [Acetobacter okinawensis]|uniref:hypothetical protein n=1 Tax=Acetobacter okinawensis TaxID=1076594 RepID=UPI001902675E
PAALPAAPRASLPANLPAGMPLGLAPALSVGLPAACPPRYLPAPKTLLRTSPVHHALRGQQYARSHSPCLPPA